ncbi:hypothetical protein C882_0388 [Caenispirillum salinarum AK4]|uniref:Na(+) H(+) antiporter subunit F n=1 Tax=Caenispirillum salinarum AK4 TaxID=1238182 RepID=K9HLZ0_9PROT|nr:monovalent cation/H+ antiporter complex subunit F [Caenispirillum salinarum]EKV29566.1 hypothetical protein C882_0388 [Caenispirillum salinarum AK4]
MTLVHAAALFCFLCAVAAGLVTLARLVKGPRAADRVNALDMLGYVVVVAAAAFAIVAAQALYIDVAMTMALLAFIGTAVMARYLMRRAWRAHHGGHPPTEPEEAHENREPEAQP